jgi:cell division septal protein FtsQ
MIRRYQSQETFKKYQPHKSKWRRFLSWRAKRKKKKLNFVYKQNKPSKVNPFKREGREKKEKRRITIKTIKIILFVLVFIAWIVLLFYLPFFKINKLSVNGLENIKLSEIESIINNKYLKNCKILPCNNYFFVSKEKIYNDLSSTFPLSSLEITKIFPRKLTINLKEKKTSLIYNNNKGYYLIDDNGQVIKFLQDLNQDDFIKKEITTTTTSTVEGVFKKTTTTIKIHLPNYKKIKENHGNFVLLVDNRDKEIKIGQKNLLTKDFISYLLNFEKKFNELDIGKVKYFILEYLDAGLRVETTNSWYVHVNQKDDIDNKLNNLQLILKENKPFSYIDLRNSNRVYWK